MRMKAKRLWAVLLTMAMILTLLPTVSFAAKPNGLVTKDGYLWVEAEDLKYEKNTFEKVKDKKMFSNGAALKIINADKESTGAELDADIDLSFQADVDGTYAIWTRNTAAVKETSGQSVYMSISGTNYAYTQLRGSVEVPYWSKIATIKVKAGETGNVRLRARQSYGINLDLFIISNEEGFKPIDQTTGLDKLIGVAPRSTPAPHTLNEENYAVLEAEDLEYNTEAFSVAEDNDASGGKALVVASEDKAVPDPADVADIDLSFVANKGGRYVVWCRSKTSGDSGGNSVFISKGDGGEYGYFALNGTIDAYQWTRLSNVAAKEGDIGYVRMSHRQRSNIKIDKFIITSDQAFVPAGKDDIPGAGTEMVLPSDTFKAPPVNPPAGVHPRLWIHAEDIPKIKENMTKEQNKYAVEKQNEILNTPITPTSKYSSSVWWYPEAKAFDYVINGNEQSAKEAYDFYMNASQIADYTGDNFEVREYGHVIYTGAKVYDWCYNAITPEQRKALLNQIESICFNLSGGYPPKSGGVVTSHTSEGIRLSQLLSFAIATYDERPDIWTCIGGQFFEQYVEARDFYYQSHSYHQGSGYTNARFGWDIKCAPMLKKSLGIDPFNMEDMNLVPYEQIYNRRPDGQPFRLGDDYNQYGYKNGVYWGYDSNTMFYASNYFGDEYLKYVSMKGNPFYKSSASGNQGEITPAIFLIMNDPDLGGKTYDDLPLTMYYPSPNGAMTARTGWSSGYDSPDVLAYMKIGELYASNHAHLDMGSFMLYYKGILAGESGYYTVYGDEHHTKYQKAGIAHNIVTVYNPNEVVDSAHYNDGGYRWPNAGGEVGTLQQWTSGEYDMAEVTGHEFGPDKYKPEYSYIAGDLTKAYSDKVSESLRSMVFMPLDDPDHPGALVVMDKVTSKDKSFEKNWLLHMEEEPQVDGNKTIVTRTEDGGSGRMVNETLLPKNPSIEVIGGEGKQFWIVDKNVSVSGKISDAAEVGWGRVEIGPATPNETDYFLNVMVVSDAGTTAPDVESTLIEDDKIAGAVFADRAVVFGKNKERISDSVSFTLPEGERKLFVAGLKAGTWDINGTEVVASEDGGCVYAPVSGGNTTLTYKNENADKTFTENKPEYTGKKIGIAVNKMFIYSDVDPVIMNDRTLVPMRAIFEKLDADVSYDDATATATATDGVNTIRITENQTTAYVNGSPVELDVPATIINDRFVVPIRFVSESFGATVEWDNEAEIVYISFTAPIKFDYEPDVPNAVKVLNAYDSGSEEGNGMDKSLDGDVSTRWAIDGNTYDNTWGVYDFGTEYPLEKIGIAFYNSDARQTYFTVEFSKDEKTWTTILDKTESDGKTEKGVYQYFDTKGQSARYVRFKWGGTSAGTWNSVNKIVFIQKK